MKKAIFAAVFCAVLTFVLPLTAMAGTSYISVKNNSPASSPVSYLYSNESDAETSKSIKTLMTKLARLEHQDSVVQTLTVSSASSGSVPVRVKLRLDIPGTSNDDVPQAPATDIEGALDYYNIKVMTADGAVIYDNGHSDVTDQGTLRKDIDLGVMNETFSTENKIFNLILSVNKDKRNYKKTAALLDWSIVTEVAEDQTEPIPETIPNDGSEENEATPAPAAAEPIRLTSGQYLAGNSKLPAGRYTVTGSGRLQVYNSAKELTISHLLKLKDDDGVNGVERVDFLLQSGDRIVIEGAITLTPSHLSATNSTTEPVESNISQDASSFGGRLKSILPYGTTPVMLIIAVCAAILLAAIIVTVVKLIKRKK